MPIRTQSKRPKEPLRVAERPALAPKHLILGAAAYAATELLCALTLGRFFDWGRAEALLFFAFRPWLSLAAALAVSRFGWRSRVSFYGLALLIAGLSQSVFLMALGAANPWPEMLRGIAAGAAVLAVLDPLLHFGRRFGRGGLAAGALLSAMLLLLPGALWPYERIILEEAQAEAAEKPDLMLMTALPIIWGETGPFDPDAKPAAAYRMLQREFTIRPLDVLDEGSLKRGRLLLLAQPRALEPSELVALDAWVRNGGRALILTDPTLVWPSELPLGDVRRAPPIGLLDPLLSHWGLQLRPSAAAGVAVLDFRSAGSIRRLAMAAPGRFVPANSSCKLLQHHLAECRIEQGRAILLADADVLHDQLWTFPGSTGDRRHQRLADNPLIIAEWLDRLAGLKRARVEGPVAWLPADAGRSRAVLWGLAPLLLAVALALLAGRSRRG